jgi:uncharacterized membrane protein YeaQ/YmgE (transglycosylase-associated protein family)
MAPLFWFLFIGLVLGLATGLIKHKDWIDFFADIEMGLLGAITGGVAFLLIVGNSDDVMGAALASSLTAVLFLGLLKRVVYREPKLHHP